MVVPLVTVGVCGSGMSSCLRHTALAPGPCAASMGRTVSREHTGHVDQSESALPLSGRVEQVHSPLHLGEVGATPLRVRRSDHWEEGALYHRNWWRKR